MILLVVIITITLVIVSVFTWKFLVSKDLQEGWISPTICYNEGTVDPANPSKCLCKEGTFGPKCGLVCYHNGKENPENPGHCLCPSDTGGDQCQKICPVGRTKVRNLPSLPESPCNAKIGAGRCDQTTGKCICKNQSLFDPKKGCNLTFAAQLGADSAARSIGSVVSGVCKNLTDQPAATMANFFRLWSDTGFPTGSRAKKLFSYVCGCKIDGNGKCPPPPSLDDDDEERPPPLPIRPPGKVPPPLPPMPNLWPEDDDSDNDDEEPLPPLPPLPPGKKPPPLPPKPTPRPGGGDLPPPLPLRPPIGNWPPPPPPSPRPRPNKPPVVPLDNWPPPPPLLPPFPPDDDDEDDDDEDDDVLPPPPMPSGNIPPPRPPQSDLDDEDEPFPYWGDLAD